MILGIDIGYGDVKVVLGNKQEIIKIFKFSSAIAKALKVSSIRDTRIMEIQLTNQEIENVYVGQDAMMLPSDSIVDIKNYELLEQYAPAFIVKALELAEVQAEQIDTLVCGLSVSQLGMSGYFKDRIRHFSVNGKEYNFGNVFLLPQGAGSKLAFDKFGDKYPNTVTANPQRTFVGVDIGFNTLDLFYVTNGKTSPNLFEGIENAGVTKIAKTLAEVINNEYNKQITLREAKEILDTKVYKLRGHSYDMQDAITKACDAYAHEILEIIEQKYGKILDKCDFVCLLGGGACIVQTQDPFFTVVRNKSEFYNAIGFYLFGTQQQV